MRPVKYRFGSYVLTGLTAPALEAQVAARGSLHQSREACHSLLYGIVLIYSGMSLVGGSLAQTGRDRASIAVSDLNAALDRAEYTSFRGFGGFRHFDRFYGLDRFHRFDRFDRFDRFGRGGRGFGWGRF